MTRLRDLAKQPDNDDRSQLGYSLALFNFGMGQVEYLYKRLLRANPAEMAVIRDSSFGLFPGVPRGSGTT